MKSKLLFIFLALCFPLHAEIITAPNLTVFEEALVDIQNDTLVIFDIDDVIITCKDPVLQQANKARFDKVCGQLSESISIEEYAHLFSIVLLTREVEIIDQKIYDLLDLLNQKNIQTIALTHTATGRMGEIEQMEDWRISELNGLGISFNHSSPFKENILLKNLQSAQNHPLTIKKGVIFAAELEKGKVLEEALKCLTFKPQRIIFIDDRKENLESVEAFCKKNSIGFQGFHYTAIQSRPIKYVDEKLIEIQIDTLIREERWISSEEAAESFNDEQL